MTEALGRLPLTLQTLFGTKFGKKALADFSPVQAYVRLSEHGTSPLSAVGETKSTRTQAHLS